MKTPPAIKEYKIKKTPVKPRKTYAKLLLAINILLLIGMVYVVYSIYEARYYISKELSSTSETQEVQALPQNDTARD